MKGITYEDMRPGSYEVEASARGHGRQPHRGVPVLPHLPPLLRPDLHRGQGQGAGPAVRQGLQRLDGRGVVRPEAEGRLIPLTIIPLWDAELAADEVRAQRRPRRAGRLLQRDPPVPRPALRPRSRPLLGPVLRGLRRDRHGRQHAHRLVLQDALDLGRRPAGGGLDPHPHQRHLLDGRLPVLGRARALPRPQAGLRRGPDRLDPLHPASGPTRCGRTTGAGAAWPTRSPSRRPATSAATSTAASSTTPTGSRSSRRSAWTTSPTSRTTRTRTRPGPAPARSPRSRWRT